MNKKCFLLIFLFILIFSIKTFSWWSAVILRESTHHKLTRKAIEQIDGAEYPDIDRFKDKICNWTSWPSDDKNAHGKKYDSAAGKYNGGPYEWWWRRTDPDTGKEIEGTLVQYKLHNFVNGDYSAYYYLAMMCHLIADQAVPAHAANILHGFPSAILNPDDLEKQSYNENPQQGGTLIKQDENLDRYYYYNNKVTGEKDGSILDTQYKLFDWKSKDGFQYWTENFDTTKKYTGVAFDSAWGYYGGQNNKDIYDEEKDTSNIIQTQFLQSVAYTAGFLQTASKKLPPLVSGLALTSNTILQNSSTTIKFEVDENRLPNVKVSLAVDNKPIKATDIVWDSAEKVLQPNGEDDQLPYQGQFSIDWDGKLADETYPADGQHDLVVMAQDTDGNWSDSNVVSFVVNMGGTVDTTPPEVVNPFPDNSILNRKNTSISATLGDTGSGVDTASVKIELDGVLKDVGVQVFEGGAIGIYYSAENLAEGTRRWKVKGRDLAGNQINDIEHTFKVDTIKPKVKSFSIGGKKFKIK